jgi:hypothetical protein
MRHSQRPVTRSRDAEQIRRCRHPSACSTPAGAGQLRALPHARRCQSVGRRGRGVYKYLHRGRAGGRAADGSVSKHCKPQMPKCVCNQSVLVTCHSTPSLCTPGLSNLCHTHGHTRTFTPLPAPPSPDHLHLLLGEAALCVEGHVVLAAVKDNLVATSRLQAGRQAGNKGMRKTKRQVAESMARAVCRSAWPSRAPPSACPGMALAASACPALLPCAVPLPAATVRACAQAYLCCGHEGLDDAQPQAQPPVGAVHHNVLNVPALAAPPDELEFHHKRGGGNDLPLVQVCSRGVWCAGWGGESWVCALSVLCGSPRQAGAARFGQRGAAAGHTRHACSVACLPACECAPPTTSKMPFHAPQTSCLTHPALSTHLQ